MHLLKWVENDRLEVLGVAHDRVYSKNESMYIVPKVCSV